MAALCLLTFVKRKLLHNRFISRTPKFFSTEIKTPDTEENSNQPIRYSTSEAATWKAIYTFNKTKDPDLTPWFQPYVVLFSVASVLIYFGILREENDIDETLNKSLFESTDAIKELQIKATINYYKEHEPNYDRSELEKRLKELEARPK